MHIAQYLLRIVSVSPSHAGVHHAVNFLTLSGAYDVCSRSRNWLQSVVDFQQQRTCLKAEVGKSHSDLRQHFFSERIVSIYGMHWMMI